ncbi:MAG: methyltransferase domain-containing protein [Rhodospirillaceae bacterium]|nr:methyltransferase domain-containing protein [Rhodospirillaceae bacterium]
MSLFVIAKGLASFVLPASITNRSGGRTHSARYCYSVYLRHLVKLAEAGLPVAPRAVAEIGPGESIGTGLAALIAGAERYVGLDVKAYALRPETLDLFDALVGLFRERAPLPGAEEFRTIKPELSDPAFPAHILTVERMAAALAPQRIADLRARIAAGGAAAPVRHIAPWNVETRIERGSIDWIFSQAVMEHVDDLAGTYSACRDWLKPGGVMSHQIDLKCHGTSETWNGHWAYSDALWRTIRGRRLYLINRAPASAHRAAIKAAGFAVVAEQPVPRQDGIARARLAARFRGLSADDLQTSGLFVVARRSDA